jgi:hypothetical protein
MPAKGDYVDELIASLAEDVRPPGERAAEPELAGKDRRSLGPMKRRPRAERSARSLRLRSPRLQLSPDALYVLSAIPLGVIVGILIARLMG